jgi:hypothetical protein
MHITGSPLVGDYNLFSCRYSLVRFINKIQLACGLLVMTTFVLLDYLKHFRKTYCFHSQGKKCFLIIGVKYSFETLINYS